MSRIDRTVSWLTGETTFGIMVVPKWAGDSIDRTDVAPAREL
jgi:hypothetical protein